MNSSERCGLKLINNNKKKNIKAIQGAKRFNKRKQFPCDHKNSTISICNGGIRLTKNYKESEKKKDMSRIEQLNW